MQTWNDVFDKMFDKGENPEDLSIHEAFVLWVSENVQKNETFMDTDFLVNHIIQASRSIMGAPVFETIEEIQDTVHELIVNGQIETTYPITHISTSIH